MGNLISIILGKLKQILWCSKLCKKIPINGASLAVEGVGGTRIIQIRKEQEPAEMTNGRGSPQGTRQDQPPDGCCPEAGSAGSLFRLHSSYFYLNLPKKNAYMAQKSASPLGSTCWHVRTAQGDKLKSHGLSQRWLFLTQLCLSLSVQFIFFKKILFSFLLFLWNV